MLIIDFISEVEMTTWPDVLYGQIPFNMNKLALSFEVTEVVVTMV